jgi:hypothetical protein
MIVGKDSSDADCPDSITDISHVQESALLAAGVNWKILVDHRFGYID